MVRNIVVLGGTSHPRLTQSICEHLGVAPADALLSNFSSGETRVEIGESVRAKDVYIVQTSCGRVNDQFMELLVTIHACKIASANRITAVLPLFPYCRQSDIPYNRSNSQTPQLEQPNSNGSAPNGLDGSLRTSSNHNSEQSNASYKSTSNGYAVGRTNGPPTRSNTLNSETSSISSRRRNDSSASLTNGNHFQPRPGYRQWVAQVGTLVADLLTDGAAGATNIMTMDLHDPQYQGFFDIPVDNLYSRPLFMKYIQHKIPNYKDAIIVSPDAGGAKRATDIADHLNMSFALIHNERRPTRISDRQNATMMLVGDVRDRTAILIDDLADTSNTIVRAANLLKREGATKIYALLTHGILSGDAIERINASALNKVVVTNTVPQDEHVNQCPKLEVLEVGSIFAEAIRRVHHGESISALFQQYD